MNHADRSPHFRNTEPVLDTQVSYRLGVPLIYVKGELSHDSAEHLRAVVEQELAADPAILILDFSDLLYIDSGGLSIMFELVHRFADPGWLGVAGAKEGTARLLEATGLLDHPNFREFPDAATAAAAAVPPDAGPAQVAH